LFVVTSSVAVAHIYREDPLRVIVSRNGLGLSIKHRHGLIVKINRKRKPQTYEASHHATPDEASECTHVFLPFSSPPHSCKCIDSNPLFK
jgi:hypothetical protein